MMLAACLPVYPPLFSLVHSWLSIAMTVSYTFCSSTRFLLPHVDAALSSPAYAIMQCVRRPSCVDVSLCHNSLLCVCVDPSVCSPYIHPPAWPPCVPWPSCTSSVDLPGLVNMCPLTFGWTADCHARLLISAPVMNFAGLKCWPKGISQSGNNMTLSY